VGRAHRTLPLAVGLLAFLPAACGLLRGDHWDETRHTVIEPINSAVHKNLPRHIRDRDLAAIRDTYATETATGLTWDDPVHVRDDVSERRIRWKGRMTYEWTCSTASVNAATSRPGSW
jgi:hypothetical protein